MQRLFPAAVALSLVLMLGVAWELRGLHAAVDVLVTRKESPMQQVTTTWTSGGLTVTVTTTRADGEKDDAFAERHKAAVTAMLAKFPKDT